MGNYRLKLGEEKFEEKKFGMSTFVSWYPEKEILKVEWKEEIAEFPCKVGDWILVKCCGGFPAVIKMRVPKDPLKRVAWEYKFYNGKRFKTLEELREKAKFEERYDHARGCYMPAVAIYISKKGNCAVAYKAALGGWIGVPWGWWANENATPEELEETIKIALGVSALHQFT